MTRVRAGRGESSRHLMACLPAQPQPQMELSANKFLKALECSLALAMLEAVDRQGLEMDVRCNLH